MSENVTGHAKSDRPQLIEKMKVLQLLEQRMKTHQQQAEKILNSGLFPDEEDWLLDDMPESSPQNEVDYATITTLIIELKSIYNQITKL